jgi:predicted permease
VINARLDAEFHKNQPQSKILLEQSGKLWGDAMRPAVGLAAGLMMVVALVLLIACANVANLLLARAASRQREIAVRLAVGAGRGRLVRQLLTESILLSLAGAAAGFLLSFWATSAVSRLDLPIPIPIELHLAPDFRVLAFTMALSLASAVLFGLSPALRATRPDLISAVKNGEMQISGFRRFGLRNALVVTQVTLSLVLLMCAGLFLRSLGRASSIDLGIEAGPVLSVAFDPNQHSASPEQRRQFLRDVKQRVAALPGIASVSYVSFLPLTVVGEQDLFVAGSAPAIHANVERVDPGYFATIGIPLLAGRDFTADSFKTTTVIVNRAFADRLFPGQNPLGQQFGGDLHQHEIVGVVANSKQRTLGEGDRPAVYLPLGDNLMSLSGVALVAKAASPAAMIEPVRRQIQSLDPNLAVFNALTMKDQTEKAMLLPRLTAALFTIFGISGLALAIVGLYGVMSFSVSRRTREIGIRMALGAERITILAMIAWQGLGLTAVGLLAGIAISLAASRFAETLLCGVSPRDLETFLAVPLLLGASDWWHP